MKLNNSRTKLAKGWKLLLYILQVLVMIPPKFGVFAIVHSVLLKSVKKHIIIKFVYINTNNKA